MDEISALNSMARFDGVPNCQTKMVLGFQCGADAKISDEDIRIAKTRISKYLFVGITDDWDRSVCLFHKMLGGKPKQIQYENILPGTYEKAKSRKEFTLSKGDRDIELYEYVKLLVYERFEKYNC